MTNPTKYIRCSINETFTAQMIFAINYEVSTDKKKLGTILNFQLERKIVLLTCYWVWKEKHIY